MHRQKLLQLLAAYEQTWVRGALPYQGFDPSEEQQHLARLLEFVRRVPACLERSCPEGHITGSALVTDPRCQQVLLTLHAKLNKWLQLGGHVDGETEVPLAALREAQEESGRPEARFFSYEQLLDRPDLASPLPFDIDIHRIPARQNEPEHFHFDLRFLCCLDPSLPFVISPESRDLRWLSLSDAQHLTSERSMQRQFSKLQALRERLFHR